ncbi:thiol reductase thioredoxin [Jannaschia sp. EhC01]|uniref:Thioredoxin family protein n=1 Tax=Gymnodinialimonas phycosphaerae TaxID=2841589 RepID=A0A975YF64_9RHOB|nr:thioredoxin family protein [Gymnodinialimonas phycosphaerae]MBY4894390.1 thioredoxin family protein [Gymnodinialimonas phycosphaerae]OAN79041.1 thiol reductase thioredoxin [Jannaschia sp. EhC01]
MNRRTLILSAAALALAPVTAMAEMIAYSPGTAEAAINAGDTVFVDFAADWCSTCRSQERTINALRDANPAYDANITFYRVDWDQYGSGDLATSLNVPRRSTLVMFRDGVEVGRVVAGTREADIRALLDTGL